MSGYFWRNNGKLVGTPPGTLIRCNDCPCDLCADYYLKFSFTGKYSSDFLHTMKLEPVVDKCINGCSYYFSQSHTLHDSTDYYSNDFRTDIMHYYAVDDSTFKFHVSWYTDYQCWFEFYVPRINSSYKLSGSGSTTGIIVVHSKGYQQDFEVTYSFTPQSSANLQLLNNDEEFE